MDADADAEVVAVASQPFWLSWSSGQRRVRHAPDFFARLNDGSAVVIDVREDGRIEPGDAAKFAASALACASVGWAYRRVGGLPRMLAANLCWLAGYRHPRCHDAVLAAKFVAINNIVSQSQSQSQPHPHVVPGPRATGLRGFSWP